MSLCLAPSAPRNPQIMNADKTSLKLQWIEPEILNGIILHYRVSDPKGPKGCLTAIEVNCSLTYPSWCPPCTSLSQL